MTNHCIALEWGVRGDRRSHGGSRTGGCFWKLLLGLPFLLLLGAFLLLIGSNIWVSGSTFDLVTDDPERLPTNDVALVLGTAKTLGGGVENLHFKYRMEAAADLFRRGKVRHILVSGDNATLRYNEPRDMKASLGELGVPAERITCDYAGFRTLDSIVRAKEVFGLQSLTVVSDDFHVPRAVFIGQRKDLDVWGFACQEVPEAISAKSRWRERLARVKAVLDLYLFGVEPRFLGDPEPISLPKAAPQATVLGN